MSLPIETLYVDSETSTLNPYDNNAKILTYQIGQLIDGKLKVDVYTEWDNPKGESGIVVDVIKRLSGLPKYTPVFTYNGMFDFLYLTGTCNRLDMSNMVKMLLNTTLTSVIKHCDLLQYDNGYLVSLDKICAEYDISSKCVFKGKDIATLYAKKDYNNIILHGEDDIERLYRLVNETDLADRFYRINTLKKNRW